MRILVANVNTTESMTESICNQAKRYASANTEIVGLTPSYGAASVETYYEGYIAAVAVMERIRAYPEAFDAIVLAGFGEPGREGLEEFFEVPVFDIAEAATHAAYLLGRRYSILTPGPGSIEGLTTDRLYVSQTLERLVSVRGTNLTILELEDDPERTATALIAAAKAAVVEDGAEVVCLSCAGMSGYGTRIREAVDVPVVDGVDVAIQLAESFHKLGYSPKNRPADPKKPAIVWPSRCSEEEATRSHGKVSDSCGS